MLSESFWGYYTNIVKKAEVLLAHCAKQGLQLLKE